ncbi:MAG: hypothetical protein WCA77_09735 [Thermoplasmata archaeon]
MSGTAYRDAEDLSLGERATLRILRSTPQALTVPEIIQRFQPPEQREDAIREYVLHLEQRGLVHRVWRPYGGALRWEISGGQARGP